MEFEAAEFRVPEMTLVADALRRELESNFDRVDVAVAECPDLTALGVASAGLGGTTALIEFGGEPYAHNPAYRGKSVSIPDMLRGGKMIDAKVFGAAMADMSSINGNSGELVPNVDPESLNLSRVARVGSERQCVVERYDSLQCGPIANLFCSEGLPGEVIRIEVCRRIAAQISLPQIMRAGLAPLVSGSRQIGLGGVFEVIAGQVRSHVMPNYSCLPNGYYDVGKEAVVGDFLQFYDDMGPGLLAFSTLWTGDPTGGALHLRASGEHTHFYHRDDAAQQAGHYHGDVSADDIHYLGYFTLAQRIFRFGDIYGQLGISP